LFSIVSVTSDFTLRLLKNIYFFKNDFAWITFSPCRTWAIEGKQTLSWHPVNNALIMAAGKYDYYYFRFRLTETSIRPTVEEKIIIKTVSIRNPIVVTPENCIGRKDEKLLSWAWKWRAAVVGWSKWTWKRGIGLIGVLIEVLLLF